MSPFVCNHDGSCDSERLCCTNTEMTLTTKDAKRIDALGYSREVYLVKSDDGFCELQNVNGHCFFYDPISKICRIYEARPDGCRYYPIVYDMKKGKCVVDRDCPSRGTITEEEIRKNCSKVKRLVVTLIREARFGEGPC